MKRKVVKQGPTTLMVSLPSQWVKRYSIAKGDELEVEEVERSICITTAKARASEPVEFDARNLDQDTIKKFLSELYKAGYDEVNILFDSAKIVPQIQNIVSSVMIGFEIVNHFENSVVIKSVSQSIEQEFDSILRRIFLLTKQLGTSSYELIAKKEYARLSEVVIIEDTNDKLTNFCMRILNKRGYKKYSKTQFMYCIIWQIEKIADEYKYIFEYLMQNPDTKISAHALALYNEAISLFNDYYELFYSYNKEGVVKLTKRSRKLIEESMQQLCNSKSKQDVFLTHCSVLLNRIYNLISPLIGLNV
ncbi:MAG: AbrB/MazE/SpoVT family DNA-binding domain-containing protein [Candidatus Woesearchaeota archaeon]